MLDMPRKRAPLIGCVVTVQEQLQGRAGSRRPGFVHLVGIEITDEYHGSYFKYIYHINPQFNDLSIRGILYYELSLRCMLQCMLVLVTTQGQWKECKICPTI